MIGMKRLALVILMTACTLGVASQGAQGQVFVTNPADVPTTWGPITLTNSGAPLNATGQARLTGVRYLGLEVTGPYVYEDQIGNGWGHYHIYWLYSYRYQGDLHVDCQGLDPQKTYTLYTLSGSSVGLKPTATGTLSFPAMSIATSITWIVYELNGEDTLDASDVRVVVGSPTGKKRSIVSVLQGVIPPPAYPAHP